MRKKRWKKFGVESLESRCLLSVLEWSSYLGGEDNLDSGVEVINDSFGNVYITGYTYSSGWVSGGYNTNFNGGSGETATDGFVAKLSSNGDHIWSTYIGGDDYDNGSDITIDSFGDIYVVGGTESSGWVSGGYDTSYNDTGDFFVVKISSSGEHIWSTYLGDDDWDIGGGIAIDSSNNLYITGDSRPVRNPSLGSFGPSDIFVAKLSSNGEYIWSKNIGGNDDDNGNDIAIDNSNNIYVTGYTSSSNWVSGGYDTSYNGGSDTFIVKLTSSGDHLWSTYLGGDDWDESYGIAIDSSNNIYIGGGTESAGWVSNGYDTTYDGGYSNISLSGDGFLAKLDSNGNHIWSTYIGGSSGDKASSVNLDSSNNIFITGSTASSNWLSSGFDTTYNGGIDAFIAKLSSSGEHLWSSYLGGNREDKGGGISVDAFDNIFISGSTKSSGWVLGGYDTTYNGISDPFVAKITEEIVKNPVLIVPGILGSLVEGRNTRAGHIRPFIKNVKFENNKIALNSYHPYKLAPEKITNSYQKIIDSFLERGYNLCDPDNPDILDDTVNCSNSDLFFAAYDWRTPVLVNPANRRQLLWDDNEKTFQSGVEYLDFWINLAKEKFIARGGREEDFSIDIIAHSMGGLVARAYIEESSEAGQNSAKVDKLVMLGTPNHGSVSSYQFLDPWKEVVGVSNITNIIIDSQFRRFLRNSIVSIENRYSLGRGSIKTEDIIPSIRDLLPSFPFYLSNTLRNPERNYFLKRLNRSFNDLVDNTNVVVIGTRNLETPVRAMAEGERLRFITMPLGDGRVVYNRIPNLSSSAGQLISDYRVKKISLLNVSHSDLLKNQRVIRVISEILEE